MRHIADYFALIDIKMECNADILEVILAARRVGTVCARNACNSM